MFFPHMVTNEHLGKNHLLVAESAFGKSFEGVGPHPIFAWYVPMMDLVVCSHQVIWHLPETDIK